MMRGEQSAVNGLSLYAADTPYQILVCICEVLNSGDQCADIAIYGQFSDAEAIAEALKKTKLFNNVHYVLPYYEHSSNMNIKYYLTASFFPKRKKKAFDKAAQSLIGSKKYARFLFASGSPYTHDLRLNCCLDDAQSILLEDGTGLYNYKVVDDMAILDCVGTLHTDKREFIKRLVRILTGKRFLFGISEIHGFKGNQLNKLYPEVSTKALTIDHGVSEYLQCVFGDSSRELIERSKYIYFALPDDTSEEVVSVEGEAIKHIIQSCKHDIALRLHPRSTKQLADFTSYDDSRRVTVSRGESWETYCLCGAIDEAKVLIGFGSTAQTTPLELCGIEPYVVFLPLMLPDSYHAKEALINIAKHYQIEAKHGERIFLPETMDELSELMSRLAQ